MFHVVVRSINTAKTVTFTRSIATDSVKWKGTPNQPVPEQEQLVKDTVDFFDQVGIDALGAKGAEVASGGYHSNPNDQVDKFARATVRVLDAQGNSIKLKSKDGSRTYDRIHIPKDKSLWASFVGYFVKSDKESFR